MVELSESGSRVLGALMAGSVAWSTAGALAASLGQDEDVTTDILADLDATGWLEVWEREADLTPAVTLSPLGAVRLGVRLVEFGLDEIAHWAPAGDPDPPAPRARHVCAQGRAAELAFVPDPHPTPDEAAARGELPRPIAATDPRATDPRLWPFPSLLIGQGLTPWPGPDRDRIGNRPCPACRNLPLGLQAYCLRCDRWGRDNPDAPKLPEPPSSPRRQQIPRLRPQHDPTGLPPRSNPNPTHPAPPGSVEQAERDRRKLRRRIKMQTRVAADREKRGRVIGVKGLGMDGPTLA